MRLNKLTFLTFILFVLTTSCSTSTTDPVTPTTPTTPTTTTTVTTPDKPIVYNTWNTYLTSTATTGKKINIGVVIETKGKNDNVNQYLEILGRLIDKGDFSFFKVNVYEKYKKYFNVYYAFVPRSDEQNLIEPYTAEELEEFRKKMKEELTKNPIPSTIKGAIETQNFLIPKAQAVGFDQSKVTARFYAKVLALSDDKVSEQEKEKIRKNLKPFDDLIAMKNNDYNLFLSEGIGGGYANTREFKAYMDYAEYLAGIIETKLITPDAMAVTFTHEMSHLIGNFVDEYYPFKTEGWFKDADGYTNNTIEIESEWKGVIFDPNVKSTIPWLANKVPITLHNNKIIELNGPISDYDGALFRGGNGGPSYRTREHTIMGDYLRMTPAEWKDGFSPVQVYIIDYFFGQKLIKMNT